MVGDISIWDHVVTLVSTWVFRSVGIPTDLYRLNDNEYKVIITHVFYIFSTSSTFSLHLFYMITHSLHIFSTSFYICYTCLHMFYAHTSKYLQKISISIYRKVGVCTYIFVRTRHTLALRGWITTVIKISVCC